MVQTRAASETISSPAQKADASSKTSKEFRDKTDSEFYWSYTDEPHATRRKQILAKYPQIKELYGPDYNTKYFVAFLAITQLALAILLRNSSVPTLLAIAWTIGGTLNHSLSLAIHEITHNLAFDKPVHNRLFSILVANPCLGVPATVAFQRYHMEHHLYQGADTIDMDIPTKLEGTLITNPITKLIWVLLQPFFYLLRPVILRPKTPVPWELANWAIQIAFDVLIVWAFGWRSLFFMVSSSILGMGFHPMAGHFIAEHYVFSPPFETYSYYGPLNYITHNVGYHNEHHDFPRIPGSRLPKVREIAPEFYDDLPKYTSWSLVIWNYITMSCVGPFSRIKRSLPSKVKEQ